MRLPFFKYEGAGNHFVFLRDFGENFPVENRALIERICDPRFGVGAEGLILLRYSQICDFQMRIFNKDGQEAGSCGNGLRCLVRFLQDLSLLSSRVSIETLGGKVFGFLQEDAVAIELSYIPEKPKPLFFFEKSPIYFVNTGVPHAIMEVPEIEKIPFLLWGKKLRFHSIFGKEGANVNFVQKKGDSYLVRTYERGVEKETFACGTGAIAVALVQEVFWEKKREVKLIFKGGMITIHLEENIIMKGPANFVFEGCYELRKEDIWQQKSKLSEFLKK